MAVNNINSYSSMIRLSGLGGSGLDTDTLVSQLMKVEKIPLDKLNQKRQLATWRQDDYRSITNLLRGIKDSFFNVLKPANNMTSQATYSKYTGTSSNSSFVTVSGGIAASSGSHTISIINLATAGSAVSNADTGGAGVTKLLEGNAVSDYNLSGKKLQITLDGITREISLDNYDFVAGPPDSSNIVSKASTGLQALVNDAFGNGRITVNYDVTSHKLRFDTAGGASSVTLAGGDALTSLGFTAGASNRINITQSLNDLKDKFANTLAFNADGKLKFTINSKQFTFDKDDSLASMMNTINSDPDAKVTMKYDETTDKFVITAKQMGYGDNIMIDTATQEGTFFSVPGVGGASGINTGDATTKQGDDATVEIDEQLLKRNSNSFTVNGVTYNLLKAHADPDNESETVSLTLDTDTVFNSIKSFVDKYNEAITTINTKLGEKYDRDYQPLTDDQKSAMKDEDIKKWEDKAKTGLLRNDSLLQGIIYDMRRALYDKVDDTSINLSSIGITTGSYEDQGKLVIDETKLKDAIKNNPDAIADLFSKKSSIAYDGDQAYDQRKLRYDGEGIANRLSDIIEDNIRTVGGKGKLLEKAGIQGDMSEFTSLIYHEIDDYNKSIADMTKKLTDKENQYYARFTAMEQAISKMNSQSSWLSQQLGGAGGQ